MNHRIQVLFGARKEAEFVRCVKCGFMVHVNAAKWTDRGWAHADPASCGAA